jgi:hypothetical protein
VDAPREEWIGVPVPDPGIPQEWVLAARKIIEKNEKATNCGRRFWELTGGILRCAACGGAMASELHHAAPDRLLPLRQKASAGKARLLAGEELSGVGD